MIVGLDMYLTGKKFTPTHDGKNQRVIVEGYEVSSMDLDLGQWRKHWALHNYIEANIVTRQFYGEGDSKFVLLDEELLEIAEAIEQGKLPDANYSPKTDAFHKEPEQVAKNAKIFRDAHAWVSHEDGCWKDVEYEGSF
tara:strand:+ start:1084 stop:1497 length:414 start_codon:yes stop_codon:yes gene_type:complete